MSHIGTNTNDMENAPERLLLPLEYELEVERLRRYLQQHPEEAAKLAINYFEDFTMVAIEYKHLERQLHELSTRMEQL